MATFCKSCGRPVRREGMDWVHYDDHLTHPVQVDNDDQPIALAPTIFSDKRVQEVFIAHQYIVMEDQQSRIDPSVFHRVETGIRCPRCFTINRMLDHGEAAKCVHCGLKMALLGNALGVST